MSLKDALARLLLPGVAAACVKVDAPARDLDWWRDVVNAANEDLSDTSRELYDRDLERIRRLEDKLGDYLKYATPLVPILAWIASVAIDRRRFWPAGLAMVAGFYLLMTYWTAQRAHATFRLHMLVPDHVAQAVEGARPVRSEVTAQQLQCTEQNQGAGIELANLIWAAERSLAYVALLLALAGSLLL